METFTLLRQHRAALRVSVLANLGSILFGFDTGIAGAVISMQSFQAYFSMTGDIEKKTNSQSNVVALLNAGCFFGALLPPFINRIMGRPHTMTLASLFLLLGGILQVASTGPSLAMMYAGRVIAGFGVGIISNLVPSYVAECSPKELRGLFMGLFELFLVIGGVLAYWASYGCSKNMAPTNMQWRIPLAIQVILAGLILLGSLFTVESPRWLAKMGRWEEAAQMLAYLRGKATDDETVMREMAEIRVQIEHELSITQGRSLKEFFHRSNWKRLAWGVLVPVFSIWCGHNAILYYGPSVFAQIGYQNQDAAILASGVFTLVKLACTILFLLVGVQVFNRSTQLVTGALVMSAFLFGLGGLLKTHPPVDGSAHTPSGRAMMLFIYLFVVGYSFSWGPLSWVYIGEMYPIRLRDYGMAMSVAIVWAMNYIISKIAPIAILHIGWKTWMIFGGMNATAFVLCFFLPETKNLTLEETDVVFGVVNKAARDQDVEAKLCAEADILVQGKEY